MAMNDAILAINDKWWRNRQFHPCGAEHAGCVAGGASGVLILSCDQPRLTAGHLRALIETFTAQAEPAIVASAYAGFMASPPYFLAACLRICSRCKRQGRALSAGSPAVPLIALPFIGGEVDIDQPGDLAQLE